MGILAHDLDMGAAISGGVAKPTVLGRVIMITAEMPEI
jgi:hypothetical protein